MRFCPNVLPRLYRSRLALDTVEINCEERVLLSIVPFMDVDSSLAVYPFPKFRMGQTNYRIYIIDRKTDKHCVWFTGTRLDPWTRLCRIQFNCRVDANGPPRVLC